MGLRVGLLDADVYGPSLPLILPEVSPVVQRSPTNPKNVLPLRAAHCPDLKMLSFGHVNPKSGAPGSVRLVCSYFAELIFRLPHFSFASCSTQGGKAAAVVRGPIATRILNQLLLATEWGDLDYLVRVGAVSILWLLSFIVLCVVCRWWTCLQAPATSRSRSARAPACPERSSLPRRMRFL